MILLFILVCLAFKVSGTISANAIHDSLVPGKPESSLNQMKNVITYHFICTAVSKWHKGGHIHIIYLGFLAQQFHNQLINYDTGFLTLLAKYQSISLMPLLKAPLGNRVAVVIDDHALTGVPSIVCVCVCVCVCVSVCVHLG